MAQKKKQLVAEGKLDKHGRPNENTPKEYLRALPDLQPKQVKAYLLWHPRQMEQELRSQVPLCLQEASAETQAGPVAMETEQPAVAAPQEAANGATEPSAEEDAKAARKREKKAKKRNRSPAEEGLDAAAAKAERKLKKKLKKKESEAADSGA